jgi:hypothetical protein
MTLSLVLRTIFLRYRIPIAYLIAVKIIIILILGSSNYLPKDKAGHYF